MHGLKHKYGWRRGEGKLKGWGKRQYAEAAFRVLYPDGFPPDGNQTALVEEINTYLRDNDPAYGLGKIDRLTVLRAAGILKPKVI